jgi:hypothetical protein
MKNTAAVLMGLMITITGLFNFTVQAAFISVEDFLIYKLRWGAHRRQPESDQSLADK